MPLPVCTRDFLCLDPPGHDGPCDDIFCGADCFYCALAPVACVTIDHGDRGAITEAVAQAGLFE